MRVADLVEDSTLQLDLRVRGDLDRVVRWVHAIEVADPAPFLRGGEVVLTTGAWQRAGQEPAEWVGRLAEAGVVAVGFGRLAMDDEPPPGLLFAAERHGLACFVVPVAVPFVQIIEAFVAAKRVEWEAPLRHQVAHHEAIAAALRVERGIGSVLRVLRRRLGLVLALEAGGQVHGDPPEPAHRVTLIGEGIADASLLLPRPLLELDMDVRAAVSSAMPFLALELERERALHATEQRYAWEVVDWIEAGTVHADTVARRLTRLGVPLDRPLRAVVARQTPVDSLSAALAPALLVERGDEAVCLVTDAPTHPPSSGYVGVGQPGKVTDLRLSLLQARHAVDTLLARGTPGQLSHEELSSPTLLLSTQDPALLHSMARTVLGAVLENDQQRGTELIPSLRVFLDHGGRWQEAAAALHVHINTLRHRMRRVEELTGRRLTSTQDRVDLFLALQVLRLSG